MLMDRFWVKVDQSGGCWLWTARRNAGGYGTFQVGPKSVLAHRFSWEMHNGPIEAGMCVCHRCDTRACVRPDHLFLGTYADNVRDMFGKGRGRKARGEGSGRSKVTEADVAEIFRMRAAGLTQKRIAEAVGISQTQVSKICLGVSWRHLRSPVVAAPSPAGEGQEEA